MFFGPHDIAAGGISGVGLVIEKLFKIDRANVVLVFNIVLLIMAFIFLGKKVFIKSIIGSLMLPLALAVIPKEKLIEDVYLTVIFGSILMAVGIVVLYRVEASSGGTTIPPLIIKKYFNISTSISLFIVDGLIVLLNLFAFGIEEFLLAILSVAAITAGMNYIETGLNKKKQILIFSKEYESINKDILESVRTGVTYFSIVGGYTKDNKYMLMVVANNKDYLSIMKIIKKYDEKALIMVSNVSEIHGKGFSYKSIFEQEGNTELDL